MFVTIRIYNHCVELADMTINRKGELEAVLRSVPSFDSYSLVRTPHGFISTTITKDREGGEETTKKVAEWVAKHYTGPKVLPPRVVTGEAQILLTAKVPAGV